MGHCLTSRILLKKENLAFPCFSGYGCGMSCCWFSPVIITSLFQLGVCVKADALQYIRTVACYIRKDLGFHLWDFYLATVTQAYSTYPHIHQHLKCVLFCIFSLKVKGFQICWLNFVYCLLGKQNHDTLSGMWLKFWTFHCSTSKWKQILRHCPYCVTLELGMPGVSCRAERLSFCLLSTCTDRSLLFWSLALLQPANTCVFPTSDI